jgi:ribokinase
MKDLGEKSYPVDRFDQALEGCHFAVMTNAPFSRPLLKRAKAFRAAIATDLQTASESSRAYDEDFLRAGDILFLSHERLTIEPEGFVATLWDYTAARLIVVGMGDSGALLCLRGSETRHVPRTPYSSCSKHRRGWRRFTSYPLGRRY